MDKVNDLVSVPLTLEERSRLRQFCLGKVEELDVYLRCDILSSNQFSFVVERKRFYLSLASKLIWYGSKCILYHFKPLFKRMVLCPDVFDIDSFVLSMKGVFGEKVVIEILIT